MDVDSLDAHFMSAEVVSQYLELPTNPSCGLVLPNFSIYTNDCTGSVDTFCIINFRYVPEK